MKGSQPALLVGANLNLSRPERHGPVRQLDRRPGLASRARPDHRALHVPHGPGNGHACVAEGEASSTGSRLILAEGKHLTITGSLFVGFDPTRSRSPPAPTRWSRVAQSIFVTGNPADDAPLVGRTLTVRSAFGGGSGAKLNIIKCSSRSEVFLAVDQFAPEAPLAVEVDRFGGLGRFRSSSLRGRVTSRGAIKADLGTRPDRAVDLAWAGEPVRRFAGTRLPGLGLASSAPLPSPDEPGRPGRPSRARGRTVQVGALRFAPPASGATVTSPPGDYALVTGTGDAAKPTGADPAEVGPGT